ncbi:MAG: helix-turn-helix domain-containing protein [Betaproteobacteria bacterium]|nr:helix-turn-helix domain-containing protein [Betaproteobacteria bacterium]
MSETAATVEEAAESPGQRPGQRLAESRAQKNLSVAEVALQLKLSTGQVEALEADAYERLPGPVFVRGFVRNYARLLDLNGEELVAALNLQHESAPPGATAPHSHNIPFPEQRPLRWRRYVAAVLILLIAVALFEILFSQPQTVVVVPPPASPAFPASDVAPPAAAPVPASEPAMPPPPVVSESPKIDAPPVSVAGDPAQAAVTGKGLADLHFVFSVESWAEVRDRNDRILFSQLNPAGAEHHVQGRPPLSVVVGNASGVKLLYNGKPFDLVPHTRVSVARFTLE